MCPCDNLQAKQARLPHLLCQNMRLGDETRDTPFDGHFAELMSALPPKANIGTQSCRAFGLIARLSQTAPKTRSSRSAASLRLRRANAPTAGCLQIERFLPDQVLAIQGTHAPIDGLAGRTLIGCAKSNAVATTVMAPSAIVFRLAHWTLSLAARGDSFSFDLLFSARDRLASDLAK